MDSLQALFLIGLCYFICHMIFGEKAYIITVVICVGVYLLHLSWIVKMGSM